MLSILNAGGDVCELLWSKLSSYLLVVSVRKRNAANVELGPDPRKVDSSGGRPRRRLAVPRLLIIRKLFSFFA